MNLLSVDRVSKAYGDKLLFQELSFGIARGEKVALIARNGTGKTTLLRILAGKDVPDSGEVTYRKDVRVAYLEQEPSFDGHRTVAELIFGDENPVVQLTRQYELALEQHSRENTPASARNLEEMTHRMDAANAWDYEARIRQVLGQLDIHDLDRKILGFSGGQQKRIALAKVLVEPSDLLILDEPTNHLDVEMVEWLEGYLGRANLSLLLVTHDRYFLDNVTDRILELDLGKIFAYDGNYAFFLEKKAEREEAESRTQDKLRNLFRTELEWVRRMPKARGTKSKARIDAFHDLKDRMGGKRKEDGLELDVKMNRIGGKIIESKKVYKAFGDRTILKGFDYTFRTGERVGIVGKNGCGKTTFLNIISGKEPPDSGKVNIGETVVFGFYSQAGLQVKEDKRVIEVVREHADVIQLADGSKVSAGQFLQLFQFPPSLQQTYVSKLSGGERRRLHLLTVLIRNPNFLILDEPTNDLDLLTLATLEEFLLHYSGCLVIVSHDRYFMDKLVDHLLVFEGEGKIRDYNGTYSELRIDQEEREKAADQAAVLERKAREQEAPAKETARKKLTYKERLEFERLESEIAALEAKKADLTGLLNGGSSDHAALSGWAHELEPVLQQLDEKSMRWLELSELA